MEEMKVRSIAKTVVHHQSLLEKKARVFDLIVERGALMQKANELGQKIQELSAEITAEELKGSLQSVSPPPRPPTPESK